MDIAKCFVVLCLILGFWSEPGFASPSNAAKTHVKAWWQQHWITHGATAVEEKQEIRDMLKILAKTKVGEKLLRAALKNDPHFFKRVVAGDNSLTETVFSRSFSLQDGSEHLDVENFLRLNRHLNRKDLILDISHELTHFIYRNPANPYGEQHSLREFIRDGIEGGGGELDAFESECYVSWELQSKYELPEHELCVRYRKKAANGEDIFQRESARHDYYNVGHYFDALSGLKTDFPELNSNSVIFSSSLQKAPYPFAMVQEFAYVRKVACENNLRKAKLIASQSGKLKRSRTPASTLENLTRERIRLEQFARNNCRNTVHVADAP